MEIMHNKEQKDELLASAHNHAKPMLSEAVFRPMLFSTPMVQALLAGRKTQTRRICKLQADADCYYIREFSDGILTINYNQGNENPKLKTPVNVGDIIWVRETWNNLNKIEFEPHYIYKANESATGKYPISKWNPSLFMPKSACRIWLKVVNVRVERLNDISEDDAINEGIKFEFFNSKKWYYTYENDECSTLSSCISYRSLWSKINGVGSWDLNPLVWVYDFEVSQDCPHGFR